MSDPITGIPMMRITPSAGLSATMPAVQGSGAAVGNGADFGTALQSALGSAIDAGHDADTQSVKAITQGGNVTEVATALARAELTLQTATAVRDRMLQAYQDIMRIQI
jgi:flagellar hook-basal body complex protein FliE